MNGTEPILPVAFFRTETGREPVREWLKSLARENRKIIGEDIKTVRVAARNAVGPETRQRPVGGPRWTGGRHCKGAFYDRRAADDSSARLPQEVAQNAKG